VIGTIQPVCGSEETAVMDLNEIKITPRDEQVLKLLGMQQ